MSDIGVTNFLFAHAAKKPASFHMPGHKGTKFYKKNGFKQEGILEEAYYYNDEYSDFIMMRILSREWNLN